MIFPEFNINSSNNISEFLEIVKKDLCTIDSICERLIQEHKKDPSDSYHHVYWMFPTLLFICSNLTSDSSVFVRLMDNGFILKLLQIIPTLDGNSSGHTFVILGKYIGCNFKSCGYYERSIYLKGAIFSKLPMLYDLILKHRIDFERRLVVDFLYLFSEYMLSEDWRYYKSAIKSFLEDGTICNVIKLLMDVISREAEYLNPFVSPVVTSFHLIRQCVQGTIYEDRFFRDELRLLHRLAIKRFSTICKDPAKYMITNVLASLSHELKSAKPEDVQFYLENRLYKKLASALVFYFSRKGDVEYSVLYNLMNCLNILESVITNFEDKVKFRDVRSLIQLLPDLVDSNKKNGSGAPPNFYKSRLYLASSVLQRELSEENYREMKRKNILFLLVENFRIFFDKGDIEIVIMLLPMIILCIAPEHVSCWLSLSEIDQVLPCIPVILKLLSRQFDGTYSEKQDVAVFDMISTQICSSLVKSLLRIKENRKHICIGAQLDVLRKCNFISCLGRALVREEIIMEVMIPNRAIMVELMQIIYQSSRLFGDLEVMECLCEILPELANKQLESFANETGDAEFNEGFKRQCLWIMRKAAAYKLDNLHPSFVMQIAHQVFSGWETFMKSEDRMCFSCDLQTDEEASLAIEAVLDESIVDVLRGTWWIIKKYPDLVNTKLPMFNSVFQVESSDGNTTDIASSVIIETITSYLDNPQDKCAEFLLELTSFVKDLSKDCVRSDTKKMFCDVLLPACKSFMKLNKNETNSANLQYFIDANNCNGVMCNGLYLD